MNDAILEKEILTDFLGKGEAKQIDVLLQYTGRQPIHVAKKTGLVFVKNRRGYKEIADDWSNKVFGTFCDDSHFTARIPAVKARQTYVADYMDVNIGLSGKKLCDIGAGEGQFLEILTKNYTCEVFGIEPSEINCGFLKQNGFNFFHGALEDYRNSNCYKKDTFDVVTLLWTLCNVSNCTEIISAAYDMLKPDGYIVIGEGSRIIVPFKKPLNLHFSSVSKTDMHPWYFSANALKNLLQLFNFEIYCINRFIDTDYLCVIGQKRTKQFSKKYELDDYRKIIDFFERWHIETQFYYSD